MKIVPYLVAFLQLLSSCKNENAPKAMKEVEVRKDGADGLIVSVSLVDGNGDPTSATGLLVVQVQGISQQDTVFTVTEMDTALTEANFRPLTFGAGSLEKKMLGFESGRIVYQTATYRKTNKKGLLLVSFKPEDGPVLQQTVTYEQ